MGCKLSSKKRRHYKFGSVNDNVNNNKRNINELLSDISVNTKNISDGVNGKSSIYKIILAVICTLSLFTVVYFGILLHPDISFGLDSFVSFINNALFLVLLPCVYLFFFNSFDGKIIFRRNKNV